MVFFLLLKQPALGFKSSSLIYLAVWADVDVTEIDKTKGDNRKVTLPLYPKDASLENKLFEQDL